MGVETVGVDHREFCGGGFPAGDGLAFDEFAECGAWLVFGSASLCGAGSGWFVFDIAGC